MAGFPLDQAAYRTPLYVLRDSDQTTAAVVTSARVTAPYEESENWGFESARCRYDLTDAGSSPLHTDVSLLVL
jgi:hypothetical protein